MAPPMDGSRFGNLRASRSSPALTAAFNLRQYSASRKLPGIEHSTKSSQFPLETLKELERRKSIAADQIVWRQIEEDERGAVAAEQKRIAKIQEKVKQKHEARIQELERVKMKAENEQYQKEKEEKERKIREESELRQRIKEEKERLRREQEEAERLRRLPVECETCNGSGKCLVCDGQGMMYARFLTSHVTANTKLEYGQKPQGCNNCCGFSPGIRGSAQEGTGLCMNCDGQGLIWPDLAPSPRSPKLGLSPHTPKLRHSPE